jgi:hypothetical protein
MAPSDLVGGYLCINRVERGIVVLGSVRQGASVMALMRSWRLLSCVPLQMIPGESSAACRCVHGARGRSAAQVERVEYSPRGTRGSPPRQADWPVPADHRSRLAALAYDGLRERMRHLMATLEQRAT